MTSQNLDAHIDDFARFISASPSSFHAAAEVARRLDDAGFTRLDEAAAWDVAGHVRAYVVRDGAIIAWVRPASSGPTTPLRILGAHTDSPGLKLKPAPTTVSHGWLQAAVEVYGGPLLNSWLDRELELGGRLVTRDGAEHLVRTGPMLRVPQLAIHLDRSSNDGLKLDKQRHMQPVFGVDGDDGPVAERDVLELLASIAGVAASDVVGHDVITVDTAPPARFGAGRTLFAAPRMDNLTSVHAGLVALLGAPDDADHISVLAAFDHEEIGSESRSGAAGPFLADVTARLSGGTTEELARMYAASWCVSSDVGHAVHPNYAERHDPTHHPVPGGGPLLKINANQRYASDAHGAALWARACEAAGTQPQAFVSNNTVPCGSTIGPITSVRLGIRTVDVGAPLLSMHSARELIHVRDVVALSGAIGAFYAGV
ncbi:M18 family aminopeptidase [Sanguibacter hominis ATCC BAA-789]|uniref:M18 family aminopeptidase n=1 Tax=Sanguibacter hominis ATCC BAA-789 TaxID=1312740 RepID=A0A9X5FAP7_9MICO|nr:M18 family aminopeptidase [Sanguibacter hominis]NKX92865.1 M18 family aminopeptidase [Sanguibacter hominis ATCC BAA-789]